MGYTPVFDSVFRGSLCGKWPELPVFLTILPLADSAGVLDYSFDYLAMVTGWPIELLREGIAHLEQPDDSSRSDAEHGCRLVRLRTNTDWGWKIVNHALYREKARLAAKNAREVASGREAERKRHSREMSAGVRRDPPVSDPSNTNTNTNTNKKRTKKAHSIPENFEQSEGLLTYAQKHLPDVDAPSHVSKFCDTARAKGWEYEDWLRAYQVYTRNCAPDSGHWAAGQYPKKAQEVWLS